MTWEGILGTRHISTLYATDFFCFFKPRKCCFFVFFDEKSHNVYFFFTLMMHSPWQKGTQTETYSDTSRSCCGGITLQTELRVGSVTFMWFCRKIRGNKLLVFTTLWHQTTWAVALALCRRSTDICLGKKKRKITLRFDPRVFKKKKFLFLLFVCLDQESFCELQWSEPLSQSHHVHLTVLRQWQRRRCWVLYWRDRKTYGSLALLSL